MISYSFHRFILIRKVVADEIINEQNQYNIKTAGHARRFSQFLVYSLLNNRQDMGRDRKYDTGIRLNGRGHIFSGSPILY
jgi:hypothetical protein